MKKGQTKYIPVAFLLLLWFLIPSSATAQQLPSEDVVVLLDCSESMSPYLQSIGEILTRFTDTARHGDSLTCYQFSSKPILTAHGRIDGASGSAQLRSQLRQLRDLGKYTNFSPAIRKGFSDIAESYSRHPEDDRLLILITDGRDENDVLSEKAVLDELLRYYSKMEAEENYFFYCFYIGDWVEKDLQEYLSSAGAHLVHWPRDEKWLGRLSLAEVRVMHRTAFLGEIPNTPAQNTFSLSFYPRRPREGLTMIELDLEEEFTKKTLDRLFDVRPRRIICQSEPWEQKFGLETRGFTKGKYAGEFIFRPTQPQMILLNPQIVHFSFAVAESLYVEVAKPLKFGPTGLGGAYEETRAISIHPGRTSFPNSADAVRAVADIDLPEGLKLSVHPVLRQGEIVVNLVVSRKQSLPENAAGSYTGTIRLLSSGGWAFTRNEIPVTVQVAERRTNYKAIVLYFGIAAGCALALVAVILSFGNARSAVTNYLADRARPEGKLVIVKDPTKGIVKSLNLALLSDRKGARELIVGTGEGVDVDLPHISMIDKTYVFSAFKTQGRVQTMAGPQNNSGQILINNISRTGRVPLKHLDSVKLGSFEFRYEEPRLLQQVVLYFQNGEVREGWLLSWDTKAEEFRFLSRADLPERNELSVRFYELKTAAFVRDFEGELTKNLHSVKIPKFGHHVKIVFTDMEELTGYVCEWKNLGDEFYFVPDLMGDNVMFFFIQRHALKEMTLIKENTAAAKKAEMKFRLLLGKMKEGFEA